MLLFYIVSTFFNRLFFGLLSIRLEPCDRNGVERHCCYRNLGSRMRAIHETEAFRAHGTSTASIPGTCRY